MSYNRSALIVMGCLLVGILAVGGGTIAVVVYLWEPPESAPAPAPEPAQSPPAVEPLPTTATATPAATGAAEPIARTAPRPTPGAGGPRGAAGSPQAPHLRPGELAEPIVIEDLTRVDPQRLFAPSRALAKRLEPRAELGSGFPVTTHGDLVGGMIDLTGAAYVNLDYEYNYLDSTRPAGKDSVQGVVRVVAKHGRLVARNDPGWPVIRHPSFDALPDPTCTVVRAWQTAVATGVPQNAVASVSYYDNSPFRKGGPFVWSFRVQGHDEHRREIDAASCALVRSWAAAQRAR